jgi:hypothetical protein
MGGQKINTRLTFTIVVQLVILVVIGLIAYLRHEPYRRRCEPAQPIRNRAG